MKEELVQILACPVCKEALELHIDKQEEEEIVSGSLYCGKCQHFYPIEEGIPNLLPPELK
jgi:uncharacterized protein YbaR (Trm112 family)